ncbi:MAG: glycine cleavage system protein T [Chloroflexota bacterium]
MSLLDTHTSQGAAVAPDGIPLHFGDLKIEYKAALENAVIMDRSHEGRLEARGRDRFNLIHRISTNDVLKMASGEGRPTIFTNATGRIIDRIMLYDRGETALVSTEAGRGNAVLNYLQRQIFFNDEASFMDLASSTHQFVLHGPKADSVVDAWVPGASRLPDLHGINVTFADAQVFLARRKPVSGAHWAIVVPLEQAEQVWLKILDQGAAFGLKPAGSLTYNALRIRAGRPAAGHELTQDFIPLEAGLWDEVSFTKGCYTGQEIIARMESRSRLAKTMAQMRLTGFIEAPQTLYVDGKPVGTLTSSVQTPDNEILGIGFVKVAVAVPEQTFVVGETSIQAVLTELAGTQPPQLVEN